MKGIKELRKEIENIVLNNMDLSDWTIIESIFSAITRYMEAQSYRD